MLLSIAFITVLVYIRYASVRLVNTQELCSLKQFVQDDLPND